MKLLLDEMLSPKIAEQLRERGHDVEAVAASEHAELDDPDVHDMARSQQRAVLTNNVRDFRPLHVTAVQPGGDGHYGLVFMSGTFRRTRDDLGRTVEALEEKLAAYPGLDDLANAEEWLDPGAAGGSSGSPWYPPACRRPAPRRGSASSPAASRRDR